MKKLVLFFFFIIVGLSGFTQTSFRDKLNIRTFRNTDKIDLHVFPNPVTTFLGVDENDIVKQIVIFNLVGRKMKAFDHIKGEKYYVGDLPKGMYLVQLLAHKNKILTTLRVSKR